PSARAAARLTVPLPEPEGPSMVMTGTLFADIEAHRSRQVHETRKRRGDIGHVADRNGCGRAQTRHGEGHGDAVITAAVDLPAAECRTLAASLDTHAAGQRFVRHAESREAGAHCRDAVALLHPQLFGARDQGLA